MSHASKFIAVALTAMTLGCASVCDSSLDCDFHAFGGVRDRHDRVNGRVESIFDPAPALAAVAPVEKPLPPADSTNGDDGDLSGDGSVEDSGLEDALLDELEAMEKLPKVPSAADPDQGESEDAESLFNAFEI